MIEKPSKCMVPKDRTLAVCACCLEGRGVSVRRHTGCTESRASMLAGVQRYAIPADRSRDRKPYSLAKILMRCARQPALNPLLMFTTPTPEAHELSIVKRGATPPKLAP
jgi:hypothetical protein